MLKKEVKTSFVKLPDGTIPKAPPFLKKVALEEGPRVSQEDVKESPDAQGAVSAGPVDSTPKIGLYDKDVLSECEMNLHQQNLLEDAEIKVASG